MSAGALIERGQWIYSLTVQHLQQQLLDRPHIVSDLLDFMAHHGVQLVAVHRIGVPLLVKSGNIISYLVSLRFGREPSGEALAGFEIDGEGLRV